MSDDDRDIDVESDDGDESDSRQSMGRGNAGNYYSQGRKRRQYHNDLERQRRDHLKGTYQELRDVLPNNAGHRLSRHETLKETHKFLSRFKEAKKKHNFNFTVEEACSLIQEERERMLGLIKKAKAKNIDLDVVPGFQQFVETHNFNEGAMSYLKPRQTPKPRTNPRRRLRRRDPTST